MTRCEFQHHSQKRRRRVVELILHLSIVDGIVTLAGTRYESGSRHLYTDVETVKESLGRQICSPDDASILPHCGFREWQGVVEATIFHFTDVTTVSP